MDFGQKFGQEYGQNSFEFCRECRSSCQEEERCLFTGRGELKCVPAKRYFANEMRLKSKRIPNNVKLEYLESWGPPKEQMCGKHSDRNPRNFTNIPLTDEEIRVYYMLIHAQRNTTIFNREAFSVGQGTSVVVPFFTVECYSKLVFMITADKISITIYVKGGGSKLHPYPSDLTTGLKMDIALLFCPRRNMLSTFVVKFGNHKVTRFDYRKTHADIPPSSIDDFCLRSLRSVALSGGCGVGVSSNLLPFEETKQYMEIWENALNAFLREKRSGNK
ncbi:uncharacterized protein [Haliotis asinina]|uniref:uncharacterized protein n=1 Tax=Haliotis asinina TaxID=109174 RepID=UPI00353225BA